MAGTLGKERQTGPFRPYHTDAGKYPSTVWAPFGAYQDLQSEPYNLDVVARHVRDLMRQGLPDYQGGPLNDQQVEWIGHAYNPGYPDRRLAPGQDLSEISRQGVSNYGPDLVNKRTRIRKAP